MNKLLTFSSLRKQILCFGMVGIIAATIHLSMVILLVQFFTLTPLLANVFGFLSAFQMSYWGNRLWTFQQTEALHRVALPKLLIVQSVLFVANEALFSVFLMLNLPYPIALLCVLTILPVFAFASIKLWVF